MERFRPILKGIGRLPRTFFKNKKLGAGFSIMLALVFLGGIGPLMIPAQKVQMGMYLQDMPPSPDHLLGTDTMGRDLLAVLVYGTRTSILIGLMAGIMGILVGVAVGFISGYEGGITDTILVSTTDVFMVLPTWPLIVILSQYLKALSLPLFATLLAIFSWPETTRRVRSQVISLKERSFVRLAKLSGQGSLEIAFREIAPNMLPYIGACFASAVSGAVLAESGLSLLGLAPVGTVTLGLNLNYATAYGAMIKGMWWWLVPTILCLVGVFLGLQLINMGLDEIYNPRLKK